MAASGASYREVSQNEASSRKWKDITISTATGLGNLHNVKLPDVAGGYAYKDSGRSGSPSRNRFIYWRVLGDVLELIEESHDFNLKDNCIRIRFPDAPICAGVTIHESYGSVIILVATVASVHRLRFPHPVKLHKYDQAFLHGSDHLVPSIFAGASVMQFSEPGDSHLINIVGAPAYQVYTAAAWLNNEDEALFAVATSLGNIVLVKMPAVGINSIVTQHELRQSSMMHRLWNGLVSAVVRTGTDGELARSLCIHPFNQDTFVFAICQDHKLRMWSCKSQECVMVADMMEYVPGHMDASKMTVSGDGHMIRKSVDSSSQCLHLAVFLSFNEHCLFCVFQPILSDGRFQLSHLTTVFCQEDELVDFCLTPTNLWTLWNNVEGDAVAYTSPFSTNLATPENWQPVFMEIIERGELEVPSHKDPRDAYVSHIFQPGNFSHHAIVKALQIYRRSVNASFIADAGLSMEALKVEVTTAVEHEIRSAASAYEMDVDEYYKLQLHQWARFYSYCTQYRDVAIKPLGLFADPGTGMVAVVKKMCLSYIRPCHLLEHLYLTPTDACEVDDVKMASFLTLENDHCDDVLNLCDSIKLVRNILTSEMMYAFEQDMYHTQSPELVARQMVTNLLTQFSNEDSLPWQQDVEVRIQSIDDIVKAIDTLLQLLDLVRAWPDGVFVDDIALSASRQLSCSHLFASHSSVCMLARSVAQIAEVGFSFSSHFLLLLTFLTQCGKQARIPLQTAEQIQCEFISRAAILVQAFFVVKWSSNMVVSHVSKSTMDASQRQLETLELSDAVTTPILHRLAGQMVTTLELFLHGQGGTQTRAILAQSNFFDDDPCPLWNSVLMPTITVIGQLVWPINANFLFPECLAWQCQYLQLQEYVRLTREWCESNASSLKFLLGLSYLNTNEPQKGIDTFMDAVPSMSNEEFLLKLIRPEADTPRHLEVLYYLKVIKLLEEFSFPHLVVSLATTAISVAEQDDPNLHRFDLTVEPALKAISIMTPRVIRGHHYLIDGGRYGQPTIWSKVFKYQLEIGHSEQAYTAMIANPDPSRRKDCLRQLLVVLCERGQLQQLVEFPYIDLHEEVVSILESRARSVDLCQHNFYDLLYAFHVFRGNYRKAGSVMYEYGLRLGREVPGIRGIQRQAKCYLAAMNALSLVDPKHAWIVKPASKTLQDDEEPFIKSPKHAFDGEEREKPCPANVEVLELDDLRKEYMLVNARLQLLGRDPDPSHVTGPTPSTKEMVALLVNAGLFDLACAVCQTWKLPLNPVFEGLASRCLMLTQQSNDYMLRDNNCTAQAWEWLEDNDLSAINTKEITAPDQAWALLQSYIQRYESPATRYHRCVTIRLLTQGFQLPSWLIASYKKINAAELLRLYLDYDYLEEAAHLCLEYVDAVLGRGSEYFGLKDYLRHGAPAVWLPYTSIDQLLGALQETPDVIYCKLYDKLHKKMKDYFAIVRKVTDDTLYTANTHASSQTRMET